jgi:Ca2+-binding EF-hand superfamily protein
MNPFATTLAATLLITLAAACARAGDHAELFSRLDADRDGRLISPEIPQEQLTLFKRLVRNADTDGDGVLSLPEFEAGLTPSRPKKPITAKVENELPGSDALLLVLAWMDLNADLTITAEEVTPEMRPLFDEFVDVLNLKNRSRIPIPQLSQQAMQFAGRAAMFTTREGIDAEVELALLSDEQWAYVERLRTSLRGRDMLENPDNALALFSRLDTDGDGKVTAGEVPEPFAERFAGLLKRADRNQDKQLSEQEFQEFTGRLTTLETNRPPVAETTQRARQLIRRSDRNGDGRLSRQETPPRMAQRFARLDQNSDGDLDLREVARAVEILATLRNSTGISPTSTPGKRPLSKNPAQN